VGELLEESRKEDELTMTSGGDGEVDSHSLVKKGRGKSKGKTDKKMGESSLQRVRWGAGGGVSASSSSCGGEEKEDYKTRSAR